ncbi:Crp/Fnr family transcriptional regulator [Micromonospora zingiberis]|uniref:Crp/Fnr family transcriptional regulator n=1 Tax=Micromonospora zingiberis TaxID=2053011 RepID=A0A4R0GGD5_9ACTN|nr:Crp/Fnr family transcriptional regulator [Micromonospora zingiberis]TCB95362.1 Crp/Fnr family transcriptional regulator [Micromonospora zingiberis]
MWNVPIDVLLALGLDPYLTLGLLLAYLIAAALLRRQGAPVARLRRAWRTAVGWLRCGHCRRLSRVGAWMRREPPQSPEWPYGTFLQRLGPPVRAALLGLGVRRQVPAGQILIHEGQRQTHLVLIEEGLTKVTAALPDGRTALLSLRVGGDLVGEMSALNDRPRSATVTACGAARYSVISLARFREFLRANPDAALELAAMVSDRLRWSNRRRIDFSSYPVRIRVARVIAELSRTHGRQAPDGVVIDVRLTQPELASICGASETSVQKILRELRTDGLVDTDYRRMTVRDLPRLQEIGQLDADEC